MQLMIWCVCVCRERRAHFDSTHGGIHLAGADAVVVAHPAVVVGVLALVQDVLVAHEVGLLIAHPVTAADADGVAAVEVLEGVHAIAVALPVAALEVAALVEDDLRERERERERERDREREKGRESVIHVDIQCRQI